MSPIRPSEARRYPPNWRSISDDIRFRRAGGQCECTGECGTRHPCGRCPAQHLARHLRTGSVVVLTVAHLDRTPENCDPANLTAMCQACHLAYDRDQHVAASRRTRQRRRRAGMEPLFPLDEPDTP